MKLKPVKRKKLVPVDQSPVKTPKMPEKRKKKKSESVLPSNEYKPLLPPKRILVREFPQKNSAELGKLYLEVSVKRYGEDLENAPEVYLQMYQESDFYTGYRKGGSHFPLEHLYDIIDLLTDLSEKCDEEGIE